MGVKFTMDPKQQGPVKLAIFSDTCGNLIQMYQPLQNNFSADPDF
jgi:glyoxylase I family protein